MLVERFGAGVAGKVPLSISHANLLNSAQRLTMETLLLVTVLVGTLVLLGFSAVLLRRVSSAAQVDVKAEVASLLESLGTSLGQKFSSATADMASRLEQTKGDLRQQVTDRIRQGFSEIRSSVEQQLAAGREEQTGV